MAGTIWELDTSRAETVSVAQPTAALRYGVRDTYDPAEVKTLVAATAPSTYDGKVLQSYTITPQAGGVWEVEVRYGGVEPTQPGDDEFSFDTTGATTRLFQSFDTKQFIPDNGFGGFGSTWADYKGAIQVSEGKVEGVEITIPQFSFTIRRTLAHPIDPAYIQYLYEKTGKVNSDTVILNVQNVQLTFNPGELLYLGATGTQRNAEAWTITLKCSASPNVEDLVIGDIEEIIKNGHEYLWVTYIEEEDPDVHILKRVPAQVNVEQVYEEAELTPLFA